MSKFKVGDRVRIRENSVLRSHYDYVPEMETYCGSVATIASCLYDDRYNLIEFRWTWYEEMLMPESSKILITTDGTSTLARLYDGKNVVKTAEAKCAQGDTFNFDVGAGIAFDRLMGRAKAVDPQDKPQSVKLYCVKPLISWLTKGKVYESVDGRITVDSDVNHTDKFMISDGYLVPLVARPAQVGEYVLLDGVKEPLQVTCICLYGCVILSDMRHTSGWPYLVLDGYKPQAKDTTAERKPAPTCANCANWRAK